MTRIVCQSTFVIVNRSLLGLSNSDNHQDTHDFLITMRALADSLTLHLDNLEPVPS